MIKLSGNIQPLQNLNGEIKQTPPFYIGKIDNEFFNGLSAYDLAVKYGFIGTEEEWVESLNIENNEDFINIKNKIANFDSDVLQLIEQYFILNPIPTKLSEFENDKNYVTEQSLDSKQDVVTLEQDVKSFIDADYILSLLEDVDEVKF